MRLRLLTGAAAVLFACTPMFADPIAITPGKTVTPGTGTYGGKIVDTVTHNGANGALSYTENVYRDMNNPLCKGCYDFVLTPTLLDPSTVINSVDFTDFSGYALMVAYKDNGGTAPTDVSDSKNGNKITFDTDVNVFGDDIFGSPDDLIIYTDAKADASGSVTFETSSLIDDPPSFQPAGPAITAPTSVTPEPSSLVLLGTGLVGVAGAMRRRFV